MFIQEQYTMYKLAHTLMTKAQYTLVHIDPQKEEIWIEKYEKRISKVIRLAHKGYDWKNHLKQDIMHVFQKVHTMRRYFIGKTVQLYNVYISSHAPVDDWEDLKRPLRFNKKNTLSMQLYYLDQDNFFNELVRFRRSIGLNTAFEYNIPSEWEAERFVNTYKQRLVQLEQDKRKAIKDVFSFGKPRLTYAFILLNVFIFIFLEASGSSMDINHLIQFGAKYNPAILEGEWWRIVSSMFLHIGFFHLLMNMIALFYLGAAVERIYGTFRFSIIYFLAGIGGGLASFAFTVNVSAGASGAIFGLFGALLFFGLIYKKLFLQTMGKNLLFLVAFNVIFGFIVPQIDNGAHLGGLIAGFIASAIVYLPKRKNALIQIGSLILFIFLTMSIVSFGIDVQANSSIYKLYEIEELLKHEQYKDVVEKTTKILENDEFEHLAAELFFHRGYAYIKLGNNDLAMSDFESCIQLTDDIPQAYYNLALLYTDTGQIKQAKESITKAVELKPDEEDFKNVYNQLMER